MALDHERVSQVIQHFLPHIRQVRSQTPQRCFILGISGLQGSGKSTWAGAIVQALTIDHGLQARCVSLDDFYKTHDELVRLRAAHPDNLLWRQRGQPGTHDLDLAREFFSSIRHISTRSGSGSVVKVPSFDKSRFDGEGDRASPELWAAINPAALDVLVFEGWCVGFRDVAASEIEAKWAEARAAHSGTLRQQTEGTLADHQLQHLLEVNSKLQEYCRAFMGPEHFDGMISLYTSDLFNVYRWRLDQEHALKVSSGSSMTDDQVELFVRGYMPAYELYLEHFTSRKFFPASQKQHIRLKLGSQRTVDDFQIAND